MTHPHIFGILLFGKVKKVKNRTLQNENLVEKRNVLNEMRAANMNLVELRFLAIYLSKINARDETTRKVRFPLTDFVKILEIKKVNIEAMKSATRRLLSHVVDVPLDSGGYTAFQLFKRCTVDKNEDEEWYVEIDAHDDALPLMFKFKRDYFTYELCNALRLNSANQTRMYELLKQHEYVGNWTVNLDDLKALMSIDKNAYPLFSTFRRDVLDKVQTALQESTDIVFTYKPIKKGQNGKVSAICFTISKNAKYMQQLTLDEFLGNQEVVDIDEDAIDAPFAVNAPPGIDFDMLSSAFSGEFSRDEVIYLYRLSLPYIQHKHPGLRLVDAELAIYDYFALKHAQLNAKGKSVKKSRYGLLCAFVEADVKKIGDH